MRRDLLNSVVLIVKATITLSALLGVTLLFAPDAWCQQPDATNTQQPRRPRPQRRRPERKKINLIDSLKGTVETGFRFREVDGDRPGKFEENREVPKSVFVRSFHLNFDTIDSPFFVDLKALEIGERDQRYSAELERVGRFRTEILWDQIPKYYSFGSTFHTAAADGLLVVNPEVRARLQNAPNSSAVPSLIGPQFPAVVRQEVQSQATINLRTRADQFLVKQWYRPNQNWEFYFRVQHLRRSGTRPRTTGTFANENTGPNGDVVWEALGVEIPEPIQYGTTNFTLGVQYSRPKWRVGVDYNLSLFRNSIPSLTWENPFRTTDALAVSPAFNNGRNRFARAQLALPPDNDFHSVSVHGSVDLPKETQLRGAVTWGKGTQDEPFLSYTLNSAMVAPNLLPGQPQLFILPPPQPSLNGEVKTLNQDYVLASKPWKNMRFLLQYRSNDKDNQTPVIVFPGLQAFGDSGVRTPIDFYNLLIENFPSSYLRQNATATWEWEPRKTLSFELEYELEIWLRSFREAARTNEHSVHGKVSYKPRTGYALKAEYLYASRKPRFYLTQPLEFDPTVLGGSWITRPSTIFIEGLREEFNQLRRFDENSRIRNNGEVSLEVTKWENMNFAATYRYTRDDYDKNFYGLHYDVQSAVDAEFSYFPRESTFIYANYSRELNQQGYRDLGHRTAGVTRNVTSCCAQFPIANTYDRSSRINFDMLQVGFNTSTEGERTVITGSYGFGFARDRTHTANPFQILSVSLRTAGAYNYPDVINRQQEVNLSLTHQLRPGIDLGFTYRFEPYRLDDFYTNNLVPYSPMQRAATVAVSQTPRYLFLDARFTSYHANVATVFVRYSF